MPPNRPKTVQTTRTSFQILNELVSRDGASADQLSSELNLAESTIYRHLSTLREIGYVVKESGEHFPSHRFLQFCEYSRTRKEGYRLVKPQIDELAEKTGERVSFVVEEHGKGVYVFQSFGDNAVDIAMSLGGQIPLHSTAAGKAILAFLPGHMVTQIIDNHGLTEFTENTITDKDPFFEELDAIRDRGYSFNNQENINRLKAVGAPIQEPGGLVLGSVVVAGPSERMKGEWFEHEIPELLLGITNEVELNISYSGQ